MDSVVAIKPRRIKKGPNLSNEMSSKRPPPPDDIHMTRPTKE